MKSLLPMVKHRDWDGVQSLWVLPAARRLYLVGAIIAVGATLLGVVIALAFQLLSLKGADTEAVPEATAVAPSPIDLAALDKLFQGPTDISTATFQLIRPVQAGAPVARLSAQSRAGLRASRKAISLSAAGMRNWFSMRATPTNPAVRSLSPPNAMRQC